MSGHRPWDEVRAEKARRDAERGRTPITSARPRYRVLARRFDDYVTGFELLIYRIDPARPVPGEVLGVTRVEGGHLDVVRARQAVVDYVKLRSEPFASQIITSDVELYLEV